jgi:hypothetical protein
MIRQSNQMETASTRILEGFMNRFECLPKRSRALGNSTIGIRVRRKYGRRIAHSRSTWDASSSEVAECRPASDRGRFPVQVRVLPYGHRGKFRVIMGRDDVK